MRTNRNFTLIYILLVIGQILICNFINTGPYLMLSVLPALILCLPPGIPVAAVGLDRGDNAAILAAEILSIGDEAVAKALQDYRREQADKVIADSEQVVADAGC